MTERAAVLVAVLGLNTLGCVGMMPSLRDRHPVGYDKLVAVAPECSDASLKTWGACDAAAELLEAANGRSATMAFLVHWEQTAFGDTERSRRAAVQNQDALGSIVQGSVVADALAAMARIDLPVLRKVYAGFGDAYSMTMLANAELITPQGLASSAVLDSFRAAHVAAMTSSQAPGRPASGAK
jgi:hypothetical protein